MILLATLLYGQFKNHTQINQNMQFLSAQQRAYQ